MSLSSTQPNNEIQICESLFIRYSVSVYPIPGKYKASNGYCREIRFHLFSPAMSANVGKPWRETKQLSKKKSNNPSSPKLRYLSEPAIVDAIANLLLNNIDLPLEVGNRKSKATLDKDEFFVYFLHNFSRIMSLEEISTDSKSILHDFARICRQVGKHPLSSFAVMDKTALQTVCEALASKVRAALGYSGVEKTSGTTRYGRLVRYVVKNYLRMSGKESLMFETDSRLRSEFNSNDGVVAKTSQSMRAIALSVRKYRSLYAQLDSASYPYDKTIAIAQAFMFFLALSPEEVCGLSVCNVKAISNYDKFYVIQITHVYEQANGKTSGKYVLRPCADSNKIRQIPVPKSLNHFIMGKRYNDHANTEPLFVDNSMRLTPDSLREKSLPFLSYPENLIWISDKRKGRKFNLAFRPESYRISCRIFWQYICGLTPGEVCYLAGLTPIDTASRHYIDYNNDHKQYRMRVQLGYGLAYLANNNDVDSYKQEANKFILYSGLKSKASLQLSFEEDAELLVSSRRGIKIIGGEVDTNGLYPTR